MANTSMGKTKTSKTRAAKPAGGGPTSVLTAPLPLAAGERGITRNAERALIHVVSGIKTDIAMCTTQEARTEFWQALHSYAGRNVQACNAGGTPTPATRKPAASAGSGIKTKKVGSAA